MGTNDIGSASLRNEKDLLSSESESDVSDSTSGVFSFHGSESEFEGHYKRQDLRTKLGLLRIREEEGSRLRHMT